MNTFILFWNPEISNYKIKDLHDALQNHSHVDNWAVWDYQKAHRGDRFFWVRCGKGKTGICMSGYFRSEPYIDDDWSCKGRVVHYSRILADIVINPDCCPILTTNELQMLIPSFDWTGGHSGQLLPISDAKILESRWKQFIDDNKSIFEVNAAQTLFKVGDSYWKYHVCNPENDNKSECDTELEYAYVSFTKDGEFEISGELWDENYEDYIKVHGINLIQVKHEYEKQLSSELGHTIKCKLHYDGVCDDDLIEKVILLACDKHSGQIDKAGKPYIKHLIRVASNCPDDSSIIVAILQDIIKDTDITAEILTKMGFPRKIINAVITLTQQKGENYESFIKRIAKNKIARIVKTYDLEDDMDIRRLSEITSEDTKRLAEYLRAWRYLKRLK